MAAPRSQVRSSRRTARTENGTTTQYLPVRRRGRSAGDAGNNDQPDPERSGLMNAMRATTMSGLYYYRARYYTPELGRFSFCTHCIAFSVASARACEEANRWLVNPHQHTTLPLVCSRGQ